VNRCKSLIDLQDVVHVLKTGYRERTKDSLNNKFQTWNYAIRGKTEDSKIIRIIIAFSKDMIIVTVMKLKVRS